MKQKFKTTFCLLAAAFCLLFPVKGQAADAYEWVTDTLNARIQYVNTTTGEPLKSQFKKIKGYTYYFDKNGYAATGFTKIDGFYYYFDSTGAMLRSEWRANRYFLSNGRMAVNQYVKDVSGRVYVGKDGTPVENYSNSSRIARGSDTVISMAHIPGRPGSVSKDPGIIFIPVAIWHGVPSSADIM